MRWISWKSPSSSSSSNACGRVISSLNTSDLLRVRRCVKHLIGSAQVQAAAADFKISGKLFARAALHFTRSGNIAKLPENLLRKLDKLSLEYSEFNAPVKKRESLSKYRIRVAQSNSLVISPDLGKGKGKNAIVPNVKGMNSQSVVFESNREFSEDIEELCRQEVTHLLLQKALELKERRNQIRKVKSEEEMERLREKYKKELRKALARKDDETILRIMEKTKMSVEDLLRKTAKPEKVEFNQVTEIFLKEEVESTEQEVFKSQEEENDEIFTREKQPMNLVKSEEIFNNSRSLKSNSNEKKALPNSFNQEPVSREMVQKEDIIENPQNEDFKSNEEEKTNKWGDVEIVSMVGPKWRKSRVAQSYEYLEFIRDLEDERFKVMNPLKYHKIKKMEAESQENVRKTTQLLLSGSTTNAVEDGDAESLKEIQIPVQTKLDFGEVARQFTLITSKKQKQKRRHSKLPRAKLS